MRATSSDEAPNAIATTASEISSLATLPTEGSSPVYSREAMM